MILPRWVYCITNNKTGKSYVGSSYRPQTRMVQHLTDLRAGKHIVEDMQADFDNNEFDFTLRILDEITDFRDRDIEYEWMKKLDTKNREKGYNYKDNKQIKERYNE